MYADDTTLTSPAEDPCVLEHKMNSFPYIKKMENVS